MIFLVVIEQVPGLVPYGNYVPVVVRRIFKGTAPRDFRKLPAVYKAQAPRQVIFMKKSEGNKSPGTASLS